MVKKEKTQKKEKTPFLIHVLKSPYYLGRGVYRLSKSVEKKSQEKKVEKKRERMISKYERFEVLKSYSGDFEKWEQELIDAESKIGIILGARGSGKTAFAMKLLENSHSKKNGSFYAMGFKKSEIPSWIEVIEDIGEIQNNSTILIDEGGILFSSRKSMTKPNKLLSDLILIARHKNLNILFISQNSSNLDVNIIRQADFLVLKPTSLLQKDFERKKIQEIYKEVEKDFGKFSGKKGVAHIYSQGFRGFVSNPLPSFWSSGISKGFR
jgi:hypothetical protein